MIGLVRIYCDNKHFSREKIQWEPSSEKGKGYGTKNIQLCKECRDLLNYSIMRRQLCPLDPKPACKKCKIHCYSQEYRSKIKEVMRFSGTYMITHGRLDLILHYLV